MSDIPDYSVEGRFVLDAFHREYASIFFYFEDAEHEAVYERLLLKLFPTIKKFQVICLGGKTNVLTKAKEERPHDKTWLFILDKDYDDLLGTVSQVSNVYYFYKYSIENYFSDVAALLHVVVDEGPREGTYAGRAEQLGDTGAYVELLETQLIKVARLFVVARRFRIDIPTSKVPLDEMIEGCDQVNPMPTDEWIQSYRDRLKTNTNATNDWLVDDANLDAQLDVAFTRTGECPLPNLAEADHICGKHLIGCLVRLIDNRLGTDLGALGAVELYIKLVTHLSPQRFAPLVTLVKTEHPFCFAG